VMVRMVMVAPVVTADRRGPSKPMTGADTGV
jgi:hypothetical protein